MRYIVQRWETSETIDLLTTRFGITADELLQANPILQSIPIYPGIILEIPGHPTIELPPEGYIEYVVQPDDTLYNIGHRFKLDYRRIIANNPQIENPNVLWPGEIIYLIYLGY
ncbi:MAG TPA: LysM peptidoglycan-binding domain-containing protein [Anaerovoracaceae bacterium]|nr:LysM peptidoglycan-binding domain-containing protein [Anaerovoracaceae bacterium]